MEKISNSLSDFLKWSCRTAGKPITFVIALTLVISWLIVGLIIGISDTWLLIIDTIATINASLMVFIIQNTQNRESKALHIKIDELLLSVKEAEHELVAIEEIEEERLEEIRKSMHYRKQQKKAEKEMDRT